MGKFGINKSFGTANGLNSEEIAEKFKLGLNNFANPYKLFTETLLRIEGTDDWSKKKNARFEIYLRYIWILGNRMF